MAITCIREFEDEIDSLHRTGSHPSLFRGQADNRWPIQSTLERQDVNVRQISCRKYFENIQSIKSEIHALSSRKFRIFDANSIQDSWFSTREKLQFPDMEFLVYLRHYGFPTPLIDWTWSKYVALFFACENFRNDTNSKVFVCSFLDEPSSTKRKLNGHTLVSGNIEADRRHYTQKAAYILPTKYILQNKTAANGEWHFVGFEEAQAEMLEEYEFHEIEISGIHKHKIIKDLSSMGIDRYTLFQSEEALIRKISDEFIYEKNRSTMFWHQFFAESGISQALDGFKLED